MEKGYSIATWRMTLRCGHPEWLEKTEELFRAVCLFYYNMILEDGILEEEGTMQQMQRRAEVLTVPGRAGNIPVHPLPFEKVPAYFRRAAINKALTAAKSQKARDFSGRTEALEASVTFFKGMYRELTSRNVELKVWDGSEFRWMHCRLKGKEFPGECRLMSPSLVKEYGRWMLHIPIRRETYDVRSAKERMQAGEKICSLQFTNTDKFVVCCVLDEAGKLLKVHFVGGGDAYRHHCARVEKKVERSWKAMGYGEKGAAENRKNGDDPGTAETISEKQERGESEKGTPKKTGTYSMKGEKKPEGQPNRKYFLRLKHLGEYYGHAASKEIVEFCKEQGAKVLVIPEYEAEYSRMVQIRAGNYSPLHLGNRIREYLEYKSWREGIVVLKVQAAGSSGRCSECGASVKRDGKAGELVVCGNGHRKNRFVNTGVNLGKKCLEGFGKMPVC